MGGRTGGDEEVLVLWSEQEFAQDIYTLIANGGSGCARGLFLGAYGTGKHSSGCSGQVAASAQAVANGATRNAALSSLCLLRIRLCLHL